MKKYNAGKIKLCYLLPEFKAGDHTHFAYLGGFLKSIAGDFDVELIVEKSGSAISDFFPVRFIRISAGLLLARSRGCRNFYVHYSFFGAFIASVISRISGARVFYWNCGEPWKYRRNMLREIFERSVYRMINFLVTGSESLAAQYSGYYGIPSGKIKIMPNWIDLEKIRDQKSKADIAKFRDKIGIESGRKVILFAHRLSGRKGAHYLPEILDGLREENAVLVILGDGPEKDAVKSKIADLGLSGKAIFLGWVPQEQIMDYFFAADVFLMPSDEEGFPHALLESMAAGIPFVASDVGSVRDMVPPGLKKFVTKSGDVPGFISRIREILTRQLAESEESRRLLADWMPRYDISVAVRRFGEMMEVRKQ